MLNRVVIVVGEPSGDLLGANLAHELRKINPNIEIEGIFGEHMINAGCLQLCSMDTLSVMGFIEPIKRLPQILALRKWIIRYVLETPPDLFIGIDAADFNLNLEAVLHKAGIKTVHYVSPSVWAWRRGRIKTIKQSVDLMLTLFPFEENFYKEHNVPARYVGHPTADNIAIDIDADAAKTELGYAMDDQVLAILPGSRNSELQNMVKTYLEAIKICHAQMPNLKFVIPLLYKGYVAYVEHFRQKIIPDVEVKYVVGNSYLVMRACDFALVTSGTATLEMMLHKKPMIIAYKTNWFTYLIAKLLVKIKHIGLPNILNGSKIVPEYIQKYANPKNIANGLIQLIKSKKEQGIQIEHFKLIHNNLRCGASLRAAEAITGKFSDDNSWS